MSATRAGAVVTMLILPVIGASAGAQGSITGTITEQGTGRPLINAEVSVEGVARSARSDSAGRYRLATVPSGARTAMVRLIGYESVSATVQVADGDTLRLDFAMRAVPARLDSVVTQEAAQVPRGIGREAFEERRRLGFGRFIDSVELRRNEHRRVGDVLRGIQGVRVVPFLVCRSEDVRRGGVCSEDWSRYTVISTRVQRDAACGLRVLVDGHVMSRGGFLRPSDWETAFDLNMLRVAEIEGIEVYRSAAEIPNEYGGAEAACGLLLIWTRK